MSFHRRLPKNTTTVLPNEFVVKPLMSFSEVGMIRVTDPCYSRDTHNLTFHARAGRWEAFIETSDQGSWGKRVASLTIHHESIPASMAKPWIVFSIEVGVDSGQVGFFDDAKYDDIPGDRYEEVCDHTLNDPYASCIDIGALSSSGHGDGCYTCYIEEDSHGTVIAARVVFIDDDEENEDDEVIEPEDQDPGDVEGDYDEREEP